MRIRCLLSTAGAAAFALSLATSSAYAQGTPPDVVHLKDGGIVRGTIVELVPSGAVTIQLVTGETRTFRVADTTYAGPSARDPASVPAEPRDLPAAPPAATTPAASASGGDRTRPYATVHAPLARIKLVGEERDLTFHLETSEAVLVAAHGGSAQGFERLCTAPCSIDLPAGYHRFALSRPDTKLAHSREEVEVRDGETVVGAYESHAGTRTAGVVLLVLAPIAGVAIMMGSLFVDSHQDCTSDAIAPGGQDCITVLDPSLPMFLAGLATLAGGVTAGVLLVIHRDTASFSIAPATAALSPPRSLGAWAAIPREGAATPAGLTATWRF